MRFGQKTLKTHGRCNHPPRSGVLAVKNHSKRMKNILLSTSLFLLFVTAACRRDEPSVVAEADDFMPLQVGNYWKVSDTDYLEVTGDTTLNGQRFCVIQTTQDRGGTLFSGQLFFRVDSNRQLIEGYANSTTTPVIADFALWQGDTVRNETFEAPTLVEKTTDRITFRYPCGLCSAFGTTYQLSFQRGRGWTTRQYFIGGYISNNPTFTEIRINGTVYRR